MGLDFGKSSIGLSLIHILFIGAFDDIWIKVLCAALALKVILAVLGIFVPALSGGNDAVSYTHLQELLLISESAVDSEPG